jgi:hypothetical protein
MGGCGAVAGGWCPGRPRRAPPLPRPPPPTTAPSRPKAAPATLISQQLDNALQEHHSKTGVPDDRDSTFPPPRRPSAAGPGFLRR